MNWRVTPLFLLACTYGKECVVTYSFHPKSSTAIHHLEELFIFPTSEPTESGDFEIRPEMTHVVFLALHVFGIDIWEGSARWVAAKDVFGQGTLLGFLFFLWLFWLRLDEHFPQTLGGDIVDSLVCGCVSEDVRDGFFQFLDRNGEAVCLVRFDHLEEWVTVSY